MLRWCFMRSRAGGIRRRACLLAIAIMRKRSWVAGCASAREGWSASVS